MTSNPLFPPTPCPVSGSPVRSTLKRIHGPAPPHGPHSTSWAPAAGVAQRQRHPTRPPGLRPQHISGASCPARGTARGLPTAPRTLPELRPVPCPATSPSPSSHPSPSDSRVPETGRVQSTSGPLHRLFPTCSFHRRPHARPCKALSTEAIPPSLGADPHQV